MKKHGFEVHVLLFFKREIERERRMVDLGRERRGRWRRGDGREIERESGGDVK